MFYMKRKRLDNIFSISFMNAWIRFAEKAIVSMKCQVILVYIDTQKIFNQTYLSEPTAYSQY